MTWPFKEDGVQSGKLSLIVLLIVLVLVIDF